MLTQYRSYYHKHIASKLLVIIFLLAI